MLFFFLRRVCKKFAAQICNFDSAWPAALALCPNSIRTQLDRFPTTGPVVWSPNLLRAQIDCWNVSRTNCQVP